MKRIPIPFGQITVDVPISDKMNVELIDLPESPVQDEEDLICAAIRKLDFNRLSKASSIGLVVSDLSRPVPNEKILKIFWEQLESYNVDKRKLVFFIASGLHRPATTEEIKKILGDFFSKEFKVVVHDAQTSLLEKVGTTFRGTPVEVNKEFLATEVKIALGAVQPHQIVGYSGGAKSIAIGLGGKDFITSNHSLLDHPSCKIGNLDNPARWEIDEVGRLTKLDLLINVVLDSKGKIAFINAGKVEESYQEAVEFAFRFFSVSVKNKKDLVIVSPGGYPKDLNLYQAQKALNAGTKLLKPGGYLILVAACEQGIGNADFLDYMKSFTRPEDLITHFKSRAFQIGPHKAYLWAQKAKEHKIILVSNLKEEEKRYLMVDVENNLESALSRVLSDFPGKIEVGIIPHGSALMLNLLEAEMS